MEPRASCFVEIYLVEGNFFSVDFGNFGITVFKETQGFSLAINNGEQYIQEYLDFLEGIDTNICSVESRKIDPKYFYRIRNMAKSKLKGEKLSILLKRIFPDCMAILAN